MGPGQATASAIVAVIQATSDLYDMLLFGNESADAGNYQVAIRVAHALGLPCVTGVKAISVDLEPAHPARARCEQEVPGGRDVYDVTLPAVVSVKEGVNLPRYPSVPGRLRAKRKPPTPRVLERPSPELEMVRLVLPPDSGNRCRFSAAARGSPGRRRDPERAGGAVMSVLVFVERIRAHELAAQALTFARSIGDGEQSIAITISGEYAPAVAWGQTLVELSRRACRGQVVAVGTERGNEVLAHAGRDSRSAAVAANTIAFTRRLAADCQRVRWGGSLLEEALLRGSMLLG